MAWVCVLKGMAHTSLNLTLIWKPTGHSSFQHWLLPASPTRLPQGSVHHHGPVLVSIHLYSTTCTHCLCFALNLLFPWQAPWLPLSCQLHWSGAVPQLWPEGPLEGGPKRQDRLTTLPHTWSTTGTRTRTAQGPAEHIQVTAEIEWGESPAWSKIIHKCVLIMS